MSFSFKTPHKNTTAIEENKSKKKHEDDEKKSIDLVT